MELHYLINLINFLSK